MAGVTLAVTVECYTLLRRIFFAQIESALGIFVTSNKCNKNNTVTSVTADCNIALRYTPAKGVGRNVRQVPPFRGGLMLRPCPAILASDQGQLTRHQLRSNWRADRYAKTPRAWAAWVMDSNSTKRKG